VKKTLILLLSIAPAALAADLVGRFEPGSRYEEPAVHAPANVSRMFARTVTRDAAAAGLDIPATGDSSMIVWTIPATPEAAGGRVRTTLRTPAGAVLAPSDRGSLERGLRRFTLDPAETAELGVAGGAQEVLHVARASAASYHLDLGLPEDVKGVTVVVAQPESALTLSTWAAPLSRQPGEPVTLYAELLDGEVRVPGALVTARLASPDGRAHASMPLEARADGTYSLVLPDLPDSTPGAWQVRFEATGRTANGTRFARTGSGELVAERGAARLLEVGTAVVGDALRVTASVDVRIAGTYRFDAIFADGSQNGIAWAEGVRTLAAGRSTIEMNIPLADLSAAPLTDLVLDARLLGLDPIGVAGRRTLAME
jgi:hypothetical protein